MFSEQPSTFFLESFLDQVYKHQMPLASSQADHTKERRMEENRKKMGMRKGAEGEAPHTVLNFQSYLGQKPNKQANPIYSGGRHATKQQCAAPKKWKGKLSLKMPSTQHKSFTRRIHL